ncbi:hypothetical protein TSOC_002107 [Tetrabaena socialis]|uniref:Bifunctional inhibitor/plant lipid transfer protein/seed storage helical domain-containing protein n=1 Tax=Tetrabaena socialis TaxID=47790 RepID=A0A2J8AEZ4_9CHLO|nr:hypothetical protein TSOC_002107 [Tetrabaena socialis]|eukprot:PNH11088.1 hypothetical protein TSOC_002107 [Tetrabaena socialis]
MTAGAFGRRMVPLCGIAVVALLVLLALDGHQVAAAPAESKTTKCQAALQLQSNPAVARFRACAGVSPIPPSCCINLAPFIQYADCLSDPEVKRVADKALAPVVTVDRALKECLG